MGISLVLEFVHFSAIVPIAQPKEESHHYPSESNAATESKGMTQEWHQSIPQVLKVCKL